MILETLLMCFWMFGGAWAFVLLVERWILSCPNGDDEEGGAE